MDANRLLSVLLLAVALGEMAEGADCGFPGTPKNGSLSSSGGMLFNNGDEVTYKCSSGFVLFGPDKRTCLANGTWTRSVPECRENMALGKSSLQSSTLWNYSADLAVDSKPDSCSFTPRSSEQRWWQVHLGDAVIVQAVAVTISPGSYQKFTIFVIELLEGNKAMYKPCSKFDGKFETKKAVFLCNDGLGHPGQFVYIRDDREEQEYFGLCEVEVFEYRNETQCGDPEQPISSIVNRTSVNTVEYSCAKGYKMDGNPTRSCLGNGVWSGHPPRCSEVQCVDPLSVKDGFIEVSNFKGKYVFGSLATYHCNPGFILWGNASRLCSEEGEWTGTKPHCKPISCGQPPEILNSRFYLMNATTSWQSLASYSCKSGHKMIYHKTNLTEITAICTESGVWQPVNFDCIFDPLAVDLKDGSTYGWASFGKNGAMNTGTLVTIGVLAALVIIVIVIVVAFFSHRRLAEESQLRKISRSSTNQLIADVANGLAAHIEGPDPPVQNSSSPCSQFHDCYANADQAIGAAEASENASSLQAGNPYFMTSFRPPTKSSDCNRSAGDGGSVVDETNYATIKSICDEDLELLDEESPYSHVRQPDGRADGHNFSMSETPRVLSSDAGYDSLHTYQLENVSSQRYQSIYAGIDSPVVQEKVYETLRKNSSGYDSLPRSMSTETSSIQFAGPNKATTGLLGINGFARTPSLHRKTKDSAAADSLYARVDRSKKKNNRGSSSSGGSEVTSPISSPTSVFQDDQVNRHIIRVTAGSNASSHENLRHSPNRPTSLYPSLNRRQPQSPVSLHKEPLYATIGSKRPILQPSSKTADV